MVITPIFPIICSVVLKFFGNEMFILRVFEVLNSAAILYIVYKILTKLDVNKGVSLIWILGIYSLYSGVFAFDYNWAVLIVQLIILYLELKYKEKPVILKRELGLGVLAGLTILFKQTSGLIFCMIFIGYKILEITDKESAKQFLKIFLARLSGVLIPVIVLAIYLGVARIFEDFVSYTILGIRTFSNSVSYFRLFSDDNIFIKILAGIIPLQALVMLVLYMFSFKKREWEKQSWFKNLFILLVYSVGTASVIFPIADKAHFAVRLYVFYDCICIFYLRHMQKSS